MKAAFRRRPASSSPRFSQPSEGYNAVTFYAGQGAVHKRQRPLSVRLSSVIADRTSTALIPHNKIISQYWLNRSRFYFFYLITEPSRPRKPVNNSVLFNCLFIFPSVYQSIHKSIYPSTHPSIHPSIYLSICLPLIYPSINQSIHVFIPLSICLLTYLFI